MSAAHEDTGLSAALGLIALASGVLLAWGLSFQWARLAALPFADLLPLAALLALLLFGGAIGIVVRFVIGHVRAGDSRTLWRLSVLAVLALAFAAARALDVPWGGEIPCSSAHPPATGLRPVANADGGR